MSLVYVALGGAIGSVARYLVTTASSLITTFPLGTLIVNVLGSLAMGYLAALCAAKFADAENVKLFLLTGLLGGFTTFSAFSLDTFALMQRGENTSAIAYVALSVVLSVVAVFAGFAVFQSHG